jgi:hypothetical protein
MNFTDRGRGNGYSISFRLNFRNIEFASHQNVYRNLPIGMSRRPSCLAMRIRRCLASEHKT